jgi:hypothetical protein
LISAPAPLHLRDRHVALGFGDLPRAVWESPTSFLLILLMIGSLAATVRFAHDASGVGRFLLGLVHSTLQLASVASVIIVASWLSTAFGLRGGWSLIAFLSLVGLLGGLGGAVGVAGYLWTANCLGFHGTEAYAPLHHQDLKHFLRLHIESDGALTVYPIGMDHVARKWTLCPEGPAHAPWFVPSNAELAPRLIEKPITITRAEPSPRSPRTRS